jgi:hypothetical protein
MAGRGRQRPVGDPGRTREQIIDFYQRAWVHADATIKEHG